MKIAFFDTKEYDQLSFEKACAGKDVRPKFFSMRLEGDTAGLAQGFDGVCVFVNDKIDAAVIQRLCTAGVKFIVLRCAGYNNVDLGYAKDRIKVAHVPAYSPHAVAEHAMALLLTSLRRIHKAYNRIKDFNFSLVGLTGAELYGKTVGVVGTGRIGRCFADICRGFGMRVLAYDKFPSPDCGAEYTDFDTLLSQSDVISFHCPLTPESYHLINRQTVERMKKGAVILNTSRGALVDTHALLDGIKSRKIGAACLDVYEEESDFFFKDLSGHIMDDDTLARLISMPNVLITSHQAFLTHEALDAIAATTVDNCISLYEDKDCTNRLC